jgi:hypothetical protein
MHFIPKTDLVSKKEIEKYLKTKNHSDIEVNKIEPTIEDIFMDLS